MHPEYDSQDKMDHDVALLKLRGELQFNDAVMPICLPTTNLEPGFFCTVTGWGRTLGSHQPIVLVPTRLPGCSCISLDLLKTHSALACWDTAGAGHEFHLLPTRILRKVFSSRKR